MSYKNPTLDEIYVRFRYKDGYLTDTGIMDVIPSLRTLGLTGTELSHTVDTIPSAQGQRVLPRIRCWDDDRLRLVQLARNHVVINQTKEYLGWSSFQNFASQVISQIESVSSALPIETIEFRALDKFEVNLKTFKIGEWINCGGNYIPEWYKDVDVSADVDMGAGNLDTDGFNKQIHVHCRTKPKFAEIRLETALSRKLSGETAWRTVLDDLHEESVEVFESLITDRVRNEIMQGEV